MLRFPLPLLAAAFASAIVAASHTPYRLCDSADQPALGIVEVNAGTAQYTFYVDDRNYVMGNGIWLYQEANGVWVDQGIGMHAGDVTDHNLQRGSSCGGEFPDLFPREASSECYVPQEEDPCWDGDWNYDRMLF